MSDQYRTPTRPQDRHSAPGFPWSSRTDASASMREHVGAETEHRRDGRADTSSFRLSRSERRKVKASTKADSRSAWHPRLLDLPVVLVLAVLSLLLGPPGALSSAFFVTAQGVPLQISPGTTGEHVAAVRHLDPRPGAKMDLAGDVRSPGTAYAGALTLTNSDADAGGPLRNGAELVAMDGRALVEEVTKKSEEIPFETVSEGSGSVVALVQRGEPGVRETLVGAGSKRTGATLVAKDPVNTVIRRTSSVASGQKAAALTFDDGPDSYTSQILAVLAQKGVPATFFVLGGNASAQPSLIQKIRDGGHQIENHTWSHPDLTRLSADQIRSEIKRTSDLLGGCNFLRPPYGSYNNTVTTVAGELGLRLALWDVDTRDWESKNRDAIINRFKAEIKPGAIILMHDGGGDRSATVAALPAIIDWLLANGYAVTTLSRLT